LSRGVHVVDVALRAATRTVVGVGDLVQRTGNDRIGRIPGGRVIERSGDVVYGLHLTRED
jgi:hypothetical protein